MKPPLPCHVLRRSHSVRSNTKDGDSPNYSTELHTIDGRRFSPTAAADCIADDSKKEMLY
jgi:hypothetical protein